MADSKIEWTGKTWNPTTGCNKVSQGCKNCYAEIMHRRLMKMQPAKYSRPFLDGAFPYEPHLGEPFKWKKGTRVFVNSMSDLFHENVPFEYIDKVFAVMALCPQHTFQVLTKRPERMKEYFEQVDMDNIWRLVNQLHHQHIKPLESELHFFDEVKEWFPLKNVWLGTSCEDQATADERIPFLLQVPAAVRFLSCEPLLGPISLTPALSKGEGEKPGIHLVIAGGESGHHSRPMHPTWVRTIRDQCVGQNVSFFFKQWGEWAYKEGDSISYSLGKNGISTKDVVLCSDGDTSSLKPSDPNAVAMTKVGKHHSGRMLDGREWNEYPEVV